MGILKRYVCVKQFDATDCGSACLVTIAKHYKLSISITKIREISGTDRNGTNILGIIDAAKEIGFYPRAVKGDKESFFIKFQLPAIAHVITKEGMKHFVVIHYISKKKVIVADPAKGILKYKPEEFFEIWTGTLILLNKNEKFQSGVKTEGALKRFMPLIISQKSLLFNIFLASMVCNALGIFGSFIYKYITDEVFQNGKHQYLHIVSLAFIILTLFKVIFEAFRYHLLITLSQKIDISMILGFYKHLMNLPMGFFDKRKTGEIISRFTDSSKVREAISGVTLVFMIDSIMVIAGGIILYLENVFLFQLTLGMVVCYAFIVYAFNNPIKKVSRELMENSSQLTSFVIESINGIETVKSFNAQSSVILNTEKKYSKLVNSIFKNAKIMNWENTLSTFFTSVGVLLIFWFGSISVIKGEMTLGQLLSFNTLLIYFFNPIKNFINLQPMLQSAIVAAERLGEILEVECENNSLYTTKMELGDKYKGKIEFRDVSFRYGKRDWVLKNINLKINPGEKVAFVGESGSGKTTLVKLLLNLYSAEKGDVLLDDINVKSIKTESIRDEIAYIPQETFLFSDTVKYNLSFKKNNIQIEDIIKMSGLTNTDEFVNKLSFGYDSVLEENGCNLSGGQRQRLSITRALLQNPKVLVMDEATSNLDSITEKAVENTIEKVAHDKTRLIIAHRLNTIKDCDKIFVMKKGEIIESGKHEELMNLEGYYYKLMQEQKC